jgi:flagellar biosynthetic protein FliQ
VDALESIVREALLLAALLCFPVLIVATAIGTLVAVLQAATQVQEQTLTLLPKMLAVGLVLALCGRFALGACATLFDDAVSRLPAIVRGL